MTSWVCWASRVSIITSNSAPLGRHVQRQAVVRHLDDVRTHLADGRRDVGQQARPVVADDPQADDPAFAHQFAGQHRGQQARVDVAAGDDQAALLAAEPFGIGQQGGQGGGAGAFHDGLLDVAVECDAALEERLLDQQHVVDQRPGDRVAQVADFLDRDALGDGRGRAVPRRVDAAHLGRERGEHGRLDADHLNVRLQVLRGRGHACDQSAAADRDRQDFQVRHVFQHLQRHRALAGHDVGIIERMDVGQLALGAEPVGRGRGLVEAVAVDHHLGAVGAGLLDLHERRGLGHHDGHGDAQPGGVIGQALAVVAGRGGDDAA
jgi:hypothetical protein